MAKSAEKVAVEFRGVKLDVSPAAVYSMRVQKAMAMSDEDPKGFMRALDMVCCGNLDEYIGIIPGEDGEVSAYGASIEDMWAFLSTVSEKLGKN